jgi:hypothetical protein
MDLQRTVYVVMVAVFAIVARQSAHTPFEAALRVTASHANAEYLLMGSGIEGHIPLVLPRDLHHLPMAGNDSVQLHRFFNPSAFHSRRYVVATTAREYLLLGGFRTPELARFAELVCDQHGADWTRRCAYDLVRVSHVRGLESLPAERARDRLAAAWVQHREEHWPQDTVLSMEDLTYVRLTGLTSLDAVGSSPAWEPVLYVFVFDADGRLVAWTFRSGQAFPAF